MDLRSSKNLCRKISLYQIQLKAKKIRNLYRNNLTLDKLKRYLELAFIEIFFLQDSNGAISWISFTYSLHKNAIAFNMLTESLKQWRKKRTTHLFLFFKEFVTYWYFLMTLLIFTQSNLEQQKATSRGHLVRVKQTTAVIVYRISLLFTLHRKVFF